MTWNEEDQAFRFEDDAEFQAFLRKTFPENFTRCEPSCVCQFCRS